MKAFARLAWIPATFAWKAFRRLSIYLVRPRFAACGKRVLFDPFDSLHHDRISIADDVFIGSGAVFHASLSSITIGSKVMFGPQVMIMGGDHNTGEIGRYMYDVHDKRPDNDQPVVIQDDVWVGARTTILKGVTVGTGSIIAAGSVVTRSIPPYSMVAGVPARVVKPRFSPQELARHLAFLAGHGNQAPGECGDAVSSGGVAPNATDAVCGVDR